MDCNEQNKQCATIFITINIKTETHNKEFKKLVNFKQSIIIDSYDKWTNWKAVFY